MSETANEKLTIFVTCRWCGAQGTVVVERGDYADFLARTRIAQEAFPYLTAAAREMLISQTCGACWEKLFPPEDDA